MNLSPARVIGWSIATILVTIAAAGIIILAGVSFETIRGMM
jgi:hypothetical protein